MSETYARRRQEPTNAGGFMLAAISVLATIAVIAGLVYATGVGARRKALLAAGDCAPVPGLVVTGLDCTTEQQLAGEYTKITTPAVQQLNADVAAYTASERHDLAAAESALMAQVTLAQALDKSLMRFPFPAAVAPQAKALMQAIDVRVKLTAEQARSSSLGQLRSFNSRIQTASAAVRTDMKLVRKALYTRPTADQEP
ncbi:MAG TPA: hypothetical protein VMB74_01765 [Streptosporangiaceae bacterium]|nr:hypothetical protein [Streptosporangiaceae bacterium]